MQYLNYVESIKSSLTWRSHCIRMTTIPAIQHLWDKGTFNGVCGTHVVLTGSTFHCARLFSRNCSALSFRGSNVKCFYWQTNSVIYFAKYVDLRQLTERSLCMMFPASFSQLAWRKSLLSRRNFISSEKNCIELFLLFNAEYLSWKSFWIAFS